MKCYDVDYLLSGKPIYVNKLQTDALQDLYEMLCTNAYLYQLSENKYINLLFDKEQFCHLIGFSYFGYNGIQGWNDLKSCPIYVSYLSKYEKFKMLQYRICNFNYIYFLLNSPEVYIYDALSFKEFSYKSIYFATYKHKNRMYKLGIGISNNGYNYPETFLNDMDFPKYNYYLLPENKLAINSKLILPKIQFLSEQKVAATIKK